MCSREDIYEARSQMVTDVTSQYGDGALQAGTRGFGFLQ